MSSKFGQMRPLVSMATDRVIMGENVVSTLAPSLLIVSSSYLQVTRISITSVTSSKFGQIGPRTAELVALERMKKSHRLIMGKMMSSHFLRYF